MKNLCSILAFLATGLLTQAQDSTTEKKKWEWNGYVKSLQSINFDKNFDNASSGNLLHNRLNVKWKPGSHFTAAAEIRNRLIWGEEVRYTPGFTGMLRNENEWLNLSVLWISKSNFVLHSNVERLWVEYRRSGWNLRLGRQRINWGITTTWNPNDIFNTYNFLDFDYEERPGSDAARLQYQFNNFSNLEVATGLAGNKNKSIAAIRYFINKWGYDVQLLAGVYQNTFTTGLGWAGSLGNAGFKAEGQAFIYGKDSGNLLNYTLELDYMFKQGWYISGAVLHNGAGISAPVNDWSKINFRFSPVNLMPARWNIITTASKEFTPLFNGKLALVYSPQVNLFIIFPSFTCNLAENLDADLVWQSFMLELQQRFQFVNHRCFLRLKWSF